MHGLTMKGKVHMVGEEDDGVSPNEMGLYNMSGNVEEWCFDAFNKKLPLSAIPGWTADNPLGENSTTLKGTSRVVRGGSAEKSQASDCYAGARSSAKVGDASNYRGFRVVYKE